MNPACEQVLDAGLDELGLVAPAEQRDRLLALVALLHKWNRAYNLTAVREPVAMVQRHLLDSLAIVPWLRGPRLLDVGSGAGLPGLVLAIMRPQLNVTLLDSNGKKVRFQRQAAYELGLSGVSAVQARVEQYQAGPFDQIVSRAFAAPQVFVDASRHLLASGGEWLAMIGRDDSLRTGALTGATLLECVPLEVPGQQGDRHLLRLEADEATTDQ
ncbi:16S rRNA (guanine(527)-N(7))-methyltransferase RsmG [Kushneria phosphatilytica]|uniref:Ribosomal RNA small subunit methyltransferase G n=1 Tax=Kushneria phosphatilytica TaxID=657387 RepID=A0A5C1A145_9GAMM|nr:16S rRNA (guanine(527)-N(7))-methyltransferase RsmG [Kushneria phosphatilytica]QEL12612.1 16S rRNA (guanine(527)-N(7))-methyltransferase RsmG [Kushneria phosphatilytica]